MTRKELQELHIKKCQVQGVDFSPFNGTTFIVQFSLSPDELLALYQALYRFDSPLGDTVRGYMNSAAEQAGIKLT